jgi:hypothetical protein
LFESQPASDKRKSLNYVVNECKWKGGELVTALREPFGMIASATVP